MKMKIKSYRGHEINEESGFTGSFIGATPELPVPFILGVRVNSLPVGGRMFLGHGRFEFDGLILTDRATGERWKMRNGEWIPTWPRATRATKSPAGRARYLRRHRNGAKFSS